MSPIKADFSGALAQTRAMLAMPKANQYVCKLWLQDTLMMLKRRAASMQKSIRQRGPGHKAGQLARNIGMLMTFKGDYFFTAAVGTGIGNGVETKYARIQDEGGVTHPRVTDRMRRWAWAMHYKEFGRAVRGEGLRGAERRGAHETFFLEDMYARIAMTRKDTLTVNVPATRWFSGITEPRRADLDEALKPENVLKVARGMAGGEA